MILWYIGLILILCAAIAARTVKEKDWWAMLPVLLWLFSGVMLLFTIYPLKNENPPRLEALCYDDFGIHYSEVRGISVHMTPEEFEQYCSPEE